MGPNQSNEAAASYTIRDNGSLTRFSHDEQSSGFSSSVGVFSVISGFVLAYILQLFWNSPYPASFGSRPTPLTVELTRHRDGIAVPPPQFDQDYGGLDFVPLSRTNESQFVRKINPKDWKKYEKERYKLLKEMQYEEEENPDPERFDHDDELNHPRECERNNWRSSLYLNCNIFHELVQEGTEKYLGEGFFRNAWLVKEHHHGSDDVFVLKRLKLPRDEEDEWFHNVHAESLTKTQREAIIMGSLKGSPRTVDVYGFCGTSTMAENMPNEIEHKITPGEGFANRTKLDALDYVHPMNNFTLEEKLDLAINMTESIADLHGFDGGLIFHADIRPDQWLVAPDGTLKLNDFNTAEIADWNIEKQEYCVVDRHGAGGSYRSPEEFQGNEIDEKVDVYSMGNTLYALLTGLRPFYEVDRDSYDTGTVMDKVVEEHATPYVDERYRTNSFIESRLVAIMETMWEYEPDDRPDIFEVVEYLRETKHLWRQCGNTTPTIDEISPEMFATCEIPTS